MVVLDCSAALCWCFSDEATPASDRLLAHVEAYGAIVPPLFLLEVANVLLQAERRRRIDPGASEALIRRLKTLPITVEPDVSSLAGLVDLARMEHLTVYDAAYLDVALRSGRPLASKDRDLLAAARRRGVAIFLLSDT
ncbi:type II toxin-antitoxin system VapC family toxin [Chthonobacter rhizosphaerae]|uniref:type II toxin-antitoxin system VapC family toxin n=1 Tax=Chthonobacter rhizosphaerae TaxID=2735553 RepID=UPI0031B5AB0C